MKKFRFIVTVIVITAFSVTLALLSKKIFTDKAEDEKLKNLITTEEPSGTGQVITCSGEFKRNTDYLNELCQQNSDCIGWLKVSGCDIDYPVMYCKEDPEFSAIGKDYRSPFVYDSDKKCHIVEKLDKVNFIILAPRYIPKRCYNFILAWPI